MIPTALLRLIVIIFFESSCSCPPAWQKLLTATSSKNNLANVNGNKLCAVNSTSLYRMYGIRLVSTTNLP